MDEGMLELRKFVAPEIIIGLDARLLINRYITHFCSSKPMIVTDKIVRKQPWFKDILNAIEEHTKNYYLFDNISSNPRDYEAMLGAELFINQECDLLIAIGGGSPIDCAKCISIVSTNGGYILNYEGVDKIKLPGPPLICIPSTAGSSADVSQAAVINDSTAKSKKAIISKKIVPDLALIDPVPLMTMDAYLTASTGMDALTHGIEAYVSNAQSYLTDVHALEAIKLANIYLEEAVKADRSIEIIYQMLLSSLQSGLAFSNALLGATHSLAHSIGGMFDLPHGECNSVLLDHIIRLNYNTVPERYRKIAEVMNIPVNDCSDQEVMDRLIKRIITLRDNLGLPSFYQVGPLSETLMQTIVINAMEDPCMVTNPKNLTSQEIRDVYEKILL